MCLRNIPKFLNSNHFIERNRVNLFEITNRKIAWESKLLLTFYSDIIYFATFLKILKSFLNFFRKTSKSKTSQDAALIYELGFKANQKNALIEITCWEINLSYVTNIFPDRHFFIVLSDELKIKKEIFKSTFTKSWDF